MRAGVVIWLVGMVQGPLTVGYELTACRLALVTEKAIPYEKIEVFALGG
jgi:hypothetical protein